MINRLKRKFIILATVSAFVLMAVLVAVMNIINYSVVVRESDATIDLLYRSNAPFFGFDDFDDFNDFDGFDNVDDFDDYFKKKLSPEVAYEARYFSVVVSAGGTILKADFSKILSVDGDTVSEYVEKALAGCKKGFIGNFRYAKRTDGRITVAVFLDCGRKLDSFRAFLLASAGVGFGGCLIVFAAVFFLSGKIVKPIAESYEKQKRFISDAGHEMKTPLTVINANLDLLEGEADKEELDDIRFQTKRLTELTNDLVYLSKMEEAEHKLVKVEMPLSDVISETANSFKAVALAKNIKFTVNVEKGITLSGAPDSIRQLVSVLLDNAVKYSPEGGTVTVDLQTSKKTAILRVANTTYTEIKPDDLTQVFERFYRTDSSRNSQTGGHGIGLSIAKAIVEAHGGNISASTESGKDFCVTAVLRLQ